MVEKSEDIIKIDGEVVENLPNALFRIKLDNGHEILGHLSGKMRINFIKLLPGDRVVVELTPYDLTKGRITYRHKNIPGAPYKKVERVDTPDEIIPEIDEQPETLKED